MRARTPHRTSMQPRLAAVLILLPLALAVAAIAEGADTDTRARVDGDGVAHLAAGGAVPASRFMSAVARDKFIKQFATPAPGLPPDAGIREVRERDEQKNAPFVERDRQLYPVDIEARVIGGVHTRVITPKAGIAPKNRARVLINLHGGGFVWGEGNGALTESIPIAGVGKITVITVAYREGPEYKFPAASEDVAAVYKELLKKHRARDIGIYGCSAGGILTTQAVAWFDKEGLPLPGAIGTFCGSASPLGGDSSHVAPLLVGEQPLPGADGEDVSSNAYFSQASAKDPLVFAINSDRLLAKFPPTLLLAGSRDFTLSSLFRVQAALSRVGVDAELHVWDGMWHAFLMDPDLPESQELFRVVVAFFDRHLGQAAARTAAPPAPSH
jgi:monoterpene epsilon-lactone hydrolase